MEPAQRQRFAQIIAEESIHLSKSIDQALSEYADAIKASMVLEDMRALDLAAVAQRRVGAHLAADAGYQARLVRFLENHDEPRAAATFPPGVHEAAAIITFLAPGLRFFHQGQFEGRLKRIEGAWWQFSLTARSEREPSALSLLKISRGRNGALEVNGRAWCEDGKLSARYWSEAVKELEDPSGIFYYWNGERPLDPNAPQLHGTAEIKLESADRASGYWTTRCDTDPDLKARTSGVYWRADADDLSILDGRDDQKRAALIAERLTQWQSVKST